MYILVVEDNKDLATNIGAYLESRGHVIDFAADGLTGLHLAVTHDYSAIILDLMLPGMDGLLVARKLREEANKSTPTIMLTARDTLEDRLQGFKSGADDYLVKPFSLHELEARLLALHRRATHTDETKKLRVADLEINLDTMQVHRRGQLIKMKPTTQRILIYLLRNSHRVVSRSEIEREIWGDNVPEGDSLRAHIYNIRTAVDREYDEKLVHTIHSIGYRVAPQSEVS